MKFLELNKNKNELFYKRSDSIFFHPSTTVALRTDLVINISTANQFALA